MERKNTSFFWSDNWYIEQNKAWFVAGEYNALFQLDMNTNQCIFEAELPEINGVRLNPRCIKCGNDIFCMPDMGNSIWVYQLDLSQFRRIEINNPNRVRLAIINFWQVNEKIFAVSKGLRQIVEISIANKKIENYYDLCSTSDAGISLSTKIGKVIYSVSVVSNQVYQFDTNTKEVIIHKIPDAEGGFHTICFDGEKFWLSGFQKQVYVWDKENNTVRVIDKFPQQFGIYNFKGDTDKLIDCETVSYDVPTFIDSVATDQFVWFLPFQTNKIIYIDKNTYTIHVFDVAGEDETKESLSWGHMNSEYLLEYMKEMRYLGIFSLKNNCILEIDTMEKVVERKQYLFHKECAEKIEKNCYIYKKVFGDLIFDRRSICRVVLEMMQSKSDVEEKDKRQVSKNIGLSIYEEINHFVI